MVNSIKGFTDIEKDYAVHRCKAVGLKGRQAIIAISCSSCTILSDEHVLIT